MSQPSPADIYAVRNAVTAEYVAMRGAADALEAFGTIALFEHLQQSAARHIDTLCDTLQAHGAKAPVLAPVPTTSHASLMEALEAAAERETATAAIYDEVIQRTGSSELKRVLLPLWQSVSHLHLTAIADQITFEQQHQTA